MPSDKNTRKLKVERTGYFYVSPPPGEGEGPAPTLVGLHGYGQTGPEFRELMERFAPEDFHTIAPQGLNQVASLRTGAVSFSWMTSFEKHDSIEQNNRFLESVFQELVDDGSSVPDAFFLLGFSQGSSVAYRFAQRFPHRVAGLISVCADLPPDVQSDLEPLAGVPVLVLFTEEDRLVPPEHPKRAIEKLSEAGMAVESAEFEGDHRVPSSQAERIRDWLRERWKERQST